MTKRAIRLLLLNRMQQLELINQAREEFEEKEGLRAVENRIDAILDEINYYRNLLQKLEEDEN